jgi:hypothetical protein
MEKRMAINPNKTVPFAKSAEGQQQAAQPIVRQSDMSAIAEQQGMSRSWIDDRIDAAAAASIEPKPQMG